MNDKTVKQFFDDHYIVRHLVVFESKDKKNRENPGAMDLLNRYNGKDHGIPYWLVFDVHGNLLADSQIRPDGSGKDVKGENSGCPASPEEVKYFISVLKRTSPITPDQILLIKKRFLKNQ